MPGHAFRDAVECQDIDAAVALLADDVVFRSPAVFKPYEGRETVERILRTVTSIFEDLRYTDELGADGVHALIFEARVGDRTLQGIDLIRADGDGRIAELTVMIRPGVGADGARRADGAGAGGGGRRLTRQLRGRSRRRPLASDA